MIRLDQAFVYILDSLSRKSSNSVLAVKNFVIDFQIRSLKIAIDLIEMSSGYAESPDAKKPCKGILKSSSFDKHATDRGSFAAG